MEEVRTDDENGELRQGVDPLWRSRGSNTDVPRGLGLVSGRAERSLFSVAQLHVTGIHQLQDDEGHPAGHRVVEPPSIFARDAPLHDADRLRERRLR